MRRLFGSLAVAIGVVGLALLVIGTGVLEKRTFGDVARRGR